MASGHFPSGLCLKYLGGNWNPECVPVDSVGGFQTVEPFMNIYG